MKEHPILFSGPMVRAILEGRKTQTRRVVKPQPTAWASNGSFLVWAKNPSDDPMTLAHFNDLSPYGRVGDHLWVRETFSKSNGAIVYRADGDLDDPEVHPWSPSIFMPRINSRITLEIINVRVERLQEISETEAKAEGVPAAWGPNNPPFGYKQSFEFGWDSINGKRKGCTWADNPWVWVIGFERAKSEPRNSAETDAQ